MVYQHYYQQYIYNLYGPVIHHFILIILCPHYLTSLIGS